MKYREFGKTGWEVSEIGFGAWGIGKSWWGPTDDETSARALRKALELGVNFIDTAYIYGDGHSEKLIASVLKERTDKIHVATKVPPKEWGRVVRSHIPFREAFPREWVLECADRSREYLRTDTLDLQQLHLWDDHWVEAPELRELVQELKEKKLIRAFGVSIKNHNPESALKLAASGLVDSIQLIYNLFDQSPAEKLLPLCQKQNIGVIVRVPLDEGGLSGSLTPQTKFHPEDFRSNYFRGNRLKETCKRVEKLNFLIRDEIQTIAQAALKFCLSHPAVSTVIPGMRRPEHAQDNCAVSDGKYLAPDELEKVKAHAWIRNFYNN